MSKIYDAIPSFPSLPYLQYLNNSTKSLSASHPSSSSSKLATHLSTIIPDQLKPIMLLSYPIQPTTRYGIPTGPTLYGKGPADVYFVVFCALAFTVAREVMMRYVWSALARWYLERESRIKAQSAKSKGKRKTPRQERAEQRKREHVVTRFAEQGWSFTYCTLSWSIGALILSRLSSPFSPQSLWAGYPHTPLPGLTKFYYLAQLGWWFHQIYVINTEKRRHDHWQMISHHVLTIGLIVGSYAGNWTRVGTVIHVLMDFCDILLPMAKMLRYLSFTTSCDIAFVAFLVGWLFTRQIGLSYVLLTVYRDTPRMIPVRWSTGEGHYYTPRVYWTYIAMLTSLLGLATAWFVMACRVAVRVVRGQGAEDSRSDDEDEGEDADGKEEQHEEEDDDVHWEPRTEGKIPSKQEIARRTEEIKSTVEESSLLSGGNGTNGSGNGTTKNQGVQMPAALKGLVCKREKEEAKREKEEARKRR